VLCPCMCSYFSFTLLSFLPFFFQCSRPHRDLHSFPTRRSSDLRSSKRQRASMCMSLRSAPGKLSPLAHAGTPTRCLSTIALAMRSEEHTSELQSRGHLVCRLLLEKKKKNKHKQ